MSDNTINSAHNFNLIPTLNIDQQIALDLNIRTNQVQATIALLKDGATVPFIARYRKEVTQNLDDAQLRDLQQKLDYYQDLEDRKKTILESINEQKKLTLELQQQINACLIKQNLEDLYLPYKPKRRTKGQIAIENGLLPLANTIMENQECNPEQLAANYVNEKILDIKSALEGARDILAEEWSQQAALLEKLRNKMWTLGVLESQVIEGKESNESEKFKDYYAYQQVLKDIPSHRLLALLRGRNLEILNLKLVYPDLEENQTHPMENLIAEYMQIDKQKIAYTWLKQVCKWTWRVKLNTSIEIDLINKAREIAEQQSIIIFSQNLKQLLLAPPAGFKITMGLDPGIRTGVKVALVDNTGKLLTTTTIYPYPPKNDVYGAIETLAQLIKIHNIELISIGNGTGSRETDKLVKEMLKQHKLNHVQKMVVNESGASIYSASAFASSEFPDLDVSLRGAVSIARRLQDPLAELIKIPPESIGVGQYQHDLDEKNLSTSLNNVVEDCVNAVGVDLNTASIPLLQRVSGLNASIAKNIVEFRNNHGKFTNREQLKQVPRLGEKTFEQAAGFLRINDGDNPLDASAVHPESYHIAEKIIKTTNHSIKDLIGNSQLVKQINIKPFVTECGRETLVDILNEFEKPGRDPRPIFQSTKLLDGVETINDLIIDMELEGTITNITAFGAFVDIGVHQDGMVHISEISDTFVKNPHDIIQTGQIVKVRVLDIDKTRNRIALSMRTTKNSSTSINSIHLNKNSHNTESKIKNTVKDNNGSMAQAFANIKINKL